MWNLEFSSNFPKKKYLGRKKKSQIILFQKSSFLISSYTIHCEKTFRSNRNRRFFPESGKYFVANRHCLQTPSPHSRKKRGEKKTQSLYGNFPPTPRFSPIFLLFHFYGMLSVKETLGEICLDIPEFPFIYFPFPVLWKEGKKKFLVLRI